MSAGLRLKLSALTPLLEGPVDSVLHINCSETGRSTEKLCSLKTQHTQYLLVSLVSWPSCDPFGFALLICPCDLCTIKNTTCSFFPVLSSPWFTSRMSMVTSVSKKSLATASMIPVAEGQVRDGRRQNLKANQVIQLLINILKSTKPRPRVKAGSTWQINKLKIT